MKRFCSVLGRRPWVALVAAWPMFLWVTLPLADLRQIGGDEGLELLKAVHLLEEGRWEASAWNDQPLLHTRLYSVLLRVMDGALGPRLWSMLASTVLLASVAALAEALVPGRLAALLAVATVVLAPLMVELSVSAMQEVPAAAFGLASVALCAGRDSARRPGLVLAAAFAAGVGMAIKLTAAVYLMASVVLLVLDGWRRPAAEHPWGRWTPSLGLFLLSLLILGGLLHLVDGRSWESLVLPHLMAFERFGPNPVSSHPLSFGTYVLQNYPQAFLGFLIGMALLLGKVVPVDGVNAWRGFRKGRSVTQKGAGPAKTSGEPGRSMVRIRVRRAVRSGREDLLRILRSLALPAIALGFNLSIRPWWAYYSLSLFLALAPVSGAALAWAFEVIGQGLRRRGPVRGWSWATGVIAGLAGFGFILSFRGLAMTVDLWRRAPRVSESEVIATLRGASAGGGSATLYAADPSYAFWSRLEVAQELVVVTRKRFLSGDWEPEDLPRAVARNDCTFVQLPRGHGAGQDGYWAGLLASNYVLTLVAEGAELYTHRRLHPAPWRQELHW